MTTAPEPDPADRLTRMAETAAQLAHEYADMAEASGSQFVFLTRRARSNRRMIWAVAASVLLDIALSVVLGISLIQLSGNAHRISQLTDRLDTAQTTTRQKTLCPLYGLFLASENPKSRAAYPQGPAAYDKAYQVIKDGYDALSCSDFVVTPPTPG